jgi:SAM-dependent methyltransferase
VTNILARLRQWTAHRRRSGEFSVEERFTAIYDQNGFGGCVSRSGPGSTLPSTAAIREELPGLLDRHGITSILDAPCGDCHWISALDWARIRYQGVDVVDSVIRRNVELFREQGMAFIRADLCVDPLPQVDLIVCRDCWVHLTVRQIQSCLDNFRRSQSRYLLATTFPSKGPNRDLKAGAIWRPLNLERPPFGFPAPLELLVERCLEADGRYADKALGLWRLADLQQ